MRIAITGAKGLLGWHAHARLHAANCAACFNGEAEPFDIVALDRFDFNDDSMLGKALNGTDAVLHFAGVNRGPDDEVESANPAIAARLVGICHETGAKPHIIYANSTHSRQDTHYGRSKRKAGEIFADKMPVFTDLILPHIFGEGARPYYNNVTATLISKILEGDEPDINPNGKVQLLHAGAAAQAAIDSAVNGTIGRVETVPTPMKVSELYSRLLGFHDGYEANIYPDFSDHFDRDLFNTYRFATYPSTWPRPLKLNTDRRGTLFEAVKGGGGGQTFLSTTLPGVSRGNHFHLGKIERFLVVQGEALIRMRKVLTDEVFEYRVSGDAPAPVDMPTLHTHSIENTGSSELLTLFWTNEMFDPDNPDTFADNVLT